MVTEFYIKMQLPEEIVNKVVMMQRPSYPWCEWGTYKELNLTALKMELSRWAKQWNSRQFYINVVATYRDYIDTYNTDITDYDEEQMEYHRVSIMCDWDEFMECIKDDWKPLNLVNYKPLDNKFLKSLYFFWHDRYH